MNAPQTMERAPVTDMTVAQPRNNVVPLSPAPKAFPPGMAKAILNVTREIGAVEKAGWNDFHKYKYQKWEDILDRVSVLLATHNLIITPSEVACSLFENEQMMSITYEFSIVNADGDVWPERPRWTAIARARDQKGVPDDKAAAKCHTQAEKYFLIHFFKIRTGDVPDSDGDGATNEKKPPNPTEAKQANGPHLIPGKDHDANTWTSEFVAKVSKAASETEINGWIEFNEQHLLRLKEKFAANHDVAQIAIDARRKALTPAKAKPPNPNAKKAEAPKVNPANPSPTEQPEEFIKWLDEMLGAISDADAFEETFNDKYSPLCDQLDQLHQEDALAVYRKHERRLEID